MGDNERVDDMPEGLSPVKKRKIMHAPEGFESARRDTGRAQAPARKFTSAFDDPKRSKLTPKDSPLRVPRPPAPVESVPQAGPSKKAPLRVLRPPALPDSNPTRPGPAEEPASDTPHSRSKTSFRPGAPSFAFSSGATTKFTLKGSDLGSPRARGKSVSRAGLQKLQPPAPPPIPEPVKPARTLNVMKPPPLPPYKTGPLLPDASKLKTISTTRVAVTMDPRTESGTEELMALHLERDAPTYIPPAERELNRGLGQSPEKASKAKTAKFCRGGLAERAKYLFSEQHTALALWYKDMTLQASRPQTHTRVAPDLCLRILSVLHVASIVSLQRSQNVPRLCIVRCAKVIRGRTTGDLTVLLDFGGPGSSAGKTHTLDEIKEGKDVHIWRPWKSSQVDEEEMRRHGAPPRDGSTLFCTRFRIV
ncbi:hypothetical protein L227DRAFT_525326 [Lentinus tigrinus ALCF2SS1-6]|uniref:Uncharacterized protein n=1 Tax=Lentinus tigrinus ALCF2SS1-6 TaxID=1328759 RepID=A0A5C2SBV8_9APHY|nr:hypothetical protein L227DRAFT_525326 [Lentinus tigrinus ALCF2SS1-6]